MGIPGTEVAYLWMYAMCDGDLVNTLYYDPLVSALVPTGRFSEPEYAEAWKQAKAPTERWYLCKQTIEPLKSVGGR